MATLFTKIMKGEIPSYKIYEDDYSFAFLDINPMQRGHTLVVPKIEVDDLFGLDGDMYGHLWETAQRLAKIIKEKTKCGRVCVVVEGYNVPHAHIHLIPTNDPGDFDKKHVHAASKEELESVYKEFTS